MSYSIWYNTTDGLEVTLRLQNYIQKSASAKARDMIPPSKVCDFVTARKTLPVTKLCVDFVCRINSAGETTHHDATNEEWDIMCGVIGDCLPRLQSVEIDIH